MVEYDSTKAYEEIKDLIEKIEWFKSNSPSNEMAMQYFINGGYAKELWQVVEMYKKLDGHLRAGGILPERWENVTRFIGSKVIGQHRHFGVLDA